MNNIIEEARRSSVTSYLDSKAKLNPEPLPTVSQFNAAAEDELADALTTTRNRQAGQQAEVDKLNAAYAEMNAPKKTSEEDNVGTLGHTTLNLDNEAANNLTRSNRTGGEVLADTGLAVLAGGKRGYSSLVSAATLSAYGLRNIEQVLGGRDIVELQEALDQADEMSRVTALTGWIDSRKSDVTNDLTKELSSIKNNEYLTETEKFKASNAFYARNPGMAGIGIVESAVGSFIEMAGFGKLGKLGGLSNKAAINLGMGASGAFGYLENAQQQGTVTNATLGYSAAAGVGTALLGIAARKAIGGTDIDSLGVNGLMSGKKGLANFARGTVQEGVEETPQNVGAGVLDKLENNKDLTEDIGINASEGMILGFGSGAFTSAPSAIAGGVQAGVDVANSKLEARDVTKHGTIEENLDFNNEKANPTRVYKAALFDMKSSDPVARKKANDLIAETTSKTYAHSNELSLQISETTNDDVRAKLIKEKKAFDDKFLAPLKAEVNNHINASTQNKDNFMLVLQEYAAAKEARLSEIPDNLEGLKDNAKANLDVELEDRLANVDPSNYAGAINIQGEAATVSASSNSGKYQTLITGKAKQYGVPATLINAIVQTESEFNPNAKSGAGAVGLMQLMPGTAKDLKVADRANPEQNIDGGVRYIGQLLKKYNGDMNNALMAYNWGMGNVDAYLKTGKGKNGQPIPQETVNYLKKIKGAVNTFTANPIVESTAVTNNTADWGTEPVTADKIKSRLKIKQNESVQNGTVEPATASFAELVQSNLGGNLKYFSAMNDTYHNGKGGRHPEGKAFDVVLNDPSKHAETTAQIEQWAADNGFKVKLLNEYANPSAKATGGHIHVSVYSSDGRGIDVSNVDDSTTTAPQGAVAEPEMDVLDETSVSTTDTNTEQPVAAETGLIDDTTADNTVTDDGIISTPKKDEEEVQAEATPEVELTKDEADFEEVAMSETRAFFSSMSDTDIDNHPLLAPVQKAALKSLSEFKRKLASEQSVDSVRAQIIDGYKGSYNKESNLGLNQYDEIFKQSIASNDVSTTNQFLGYLERFASNSNKKAEAINTAIASGATSANPTYLAADTKGDWVVVDSTQYEEGKANKASVFKVEGTNKGTVSINQEASLLTEAFDKYRDASSALLGSGVIPTTPVAKSSIDIKSSAPKPVEVAETTPVVTTGFSSINKVANENEVPEGAAYIGRSTVDNVTRSMGNIKTAEDIGKRGWLGNPFNEKVPAKNMERYIEAFKSNVAKYPEFVEELVKLKGQKLYTSEFASKRSEVGFIADMLPNLPSNTKEAAEYINRIESYNPDTGVKVADKIVTPEVVKEVPNAPVRTRHDVDAVKQRSAVPTASKQVKGKAKQGVTTTNARNEISASTYEETDNYTNSYTGKSSSGKTHTFAINREKGTNFIKDVVHTVDGKVKKNSIKIKDNTVSDELFMTKMEEALKATEEFVQDSLNTPKNDDSNVTEFEGTKVPKELVNKTVKVTEAMKLYGEVIQEDSIDVNERALLNGIINTLINFSPDMKVIISNGKQENNYNSDTNTITVNLPMTEGNVLQEVARMVISATTSKTAAELELLGSTDMVVDLNKLYDLNQDLTKLRNTVDTVIRAEDGRYSKLDDNIKVKILEAMKTNSTLLEMATTDLDIMVFLQSIKAKEEKVNQSLFTKIVNSLKSFLNVGNTGKVSNQFDKLLEITVRTASEQARNKQVDFSTSEDAKVHLYSDVDATSLAILQAQELQKNFYERNHMLVGFNQKSSKNKPLSSISDFTAKLKLDMMQGLQALVSEAPTKEQREQIEDFLKFRDELTVHIKDTFRQKTKGTKNNPDADFGYQDLKTYFMDDTGAINENVIDSVALAAYDWVIENGNKTQNTYKDIKLLLNLNIDDTVYISPEMQEEYINIGMLRPYVRAKLGKKSVDSIGIKANTNVSADAQSKLENSVGEWVISAMQSADLIHINSMSSTKHKENITDVGGELENFEAANEKGQITFVSITNMEGMDINPRLNEVSRKNKGTRGYLSNLFGIEIGLRAPLKKAPNKIIEDIKRTTAKMSMAQRQYIKKMQEEPISINKDMTDVLQNLLNSDRDTTLEMLGARVSAEDLAKEHKSNRHSKESAAEGVYRDLENGMDFVGSLTKLDANNYEPFYDSVYAAKNNRMHYNSNMFNFQSSKLHRSMGEYTNFNNDIDISGVVGSDIELYDNEGNISGAALFIRAIAESAEGTEELMKVALQGKGIDSGFTVDKVDSELFVKPFYNYIRSDADVQIAVKAINKSLAGKKLSKGEVESISKVVTFWEGGANSVRALLEYAKFENSINNGDSTFNTSLGLGSDGINNGSAISYTLFGVGNDNFFTQVGMLLKEGNYSGLANYFQTRTDSSIGDYYTGFKPHIENAFGKKSNNQINILALNTSFFERKSFKAVLIPFGYSAGMPRLRALVYGQFMSDITKQFTKLASMDTNSDTYKAAKSKMEGHLNALLTEPLTLPEGKDILEFWFSPEQENQIKKLYDKEIGGNVVEALESYAAPFIKQRERNIKIQEAAYNTYSKLRDIIINKETAIYLETLKHNSEYAEFTDAQFDKLLEIEDIPASYYAKHIQSKLDNIRPSVATPFNNGGKDWFDESDFSIAQESTSLKANPNSASSTWKVNNDGNLVGSTVAVANMVKDEVSSGVMVNSAQVQGTDAKISARASAFGGNVNINVHDANISGLLNYIAMGLEQNKATFESLRDYHAQTESLLAYSKAFNSAKELNKSGDITNEEFQDIVIEGLITIISEDEFNTYLTKNKLDKDLTDSQILNEVFNPLVTGLMSDALETEYRKFAQLSNIAVMHQYGGEGAEYTITDADLKGIETQKTELRKLFSDIQANFSGMTSTKIEIDNTPKINDEVIRPNKQFTIGAVADKIRSTMNKADSNISEQRIKMFDYVMGRVKNHENNSNRVIAVVMVDSLPAMERGRFDVATNTIQLNNNYLANANSDSKIELFLHETLHALTAVTIATNKSDDVVKAVRNLEIIRASLQSIARQQGNKYLADTVFASVDELVAYGMTDYNVQMFMRDNLKDKINAQGRKNASTGRANNGLVGFLKSVFAMFKSKNETFEIFLRSADTVTTGYTDAQLSDYNGAIYHSSTSNPVDTLKQLATLNISSEHNEHLDSIIDTVIGEYYNSNDDVSALDKVMNKVNTRAINAGYKMSDKELHVMEIAKVLSETFMTSNAGTKTASEVRNSYNRAVKQLTVDSFLTDPSTATVAERKQAQSKFNYLFKQDKLNKKEQVDRFFALSIASEEFGNILAKLDNSKVVKEESSLFGKLMEAFGNIVRWLSGRVLSTNGLNMSSELSSLFTRLAQINESAKSNRVNMFDKSYNFTTSLVTVPSNYIANKLLDAVFGTFKFGLASSNSTIRTVSNIMTNLRETGIGEVADSYLGLQTRATTNDSSNRLNGFGELIYEMGRNKGMKQVVEQLIRMTNKASQERQLAATKAKDAIADSFVEIDNVPISQLDGLTKVALRTDMSALLNYGMNINKVLKLITDSKERTKVINELEAKIASNPNANDILLQTKALGAYMATEVAPEHLVKNAEGIAVGKGSWYETDISTMNTSLRDTIDQLASLYAVEASSKDEQSELNTLVKEQPEAVKAVLNHHLEMVKRSKVDFKDNMPNYSKGYMPQKTHELRSLKFAESDIEVVKLIAQGWEIITEEGIVQDNSDKTDTRTLMFHNDMLYKDYVSGALDMKDTHAKGTMVYNIGDNAAEVNRVTAEKMAARRKRNRVNHRNYNFSKQPEGNLIASYDADGVITGYHYEMSGRLRDTYLERNNNAIDLLGMYYSNLSFKPKVAETQRTVAQELHKDFINSYGNDPRQFVTLDPESRDPNIVAMWRMMPYEFRAEATKLFGKGMPIVVRSTIYNTVFGYRTYSMSEMFDKVTGEKNALEIFITGVMSAISGDKAQMRVLQGERLWQKGISQIKDFIVIRNYKVLIGNIISNALLLSLQGVPLSHQIKDFISVWNNGGKYRELAARVVEIDSQIAINRNRPKELAKLNRERNVAMIEMARNPLHDFMEEGLMSSIVEDTNLYAEDTGYKSDLDKKIDEYVGNIPKQVVTAFNWVLMSPGTPLHNFMAHSTQFSDLAAKYSLTKYRMSLGDSKADAIAEAQGSFINYDIPTGKGLDYMNKMGLFMFTKFILRFQQAIVKQLNVRAGSAISQHLLVEELTGQAGVLEPFILNRLGNPFSAGMLNYGDAFNNISTVSFLKGLVD